MQVLSERHEQFITEELKININLFISFVKKAKEANLLTVKEINEAIGSWNYLSGNRRYSYNLCSDMSLIFSIVLSSKSNHREIYEIYKFC